MRTDAGFPSACRQQVDQPLSRSGAGVRSGADREQPLVSHPIELRGRLMRIVVGILVVFVGLSPFSNPIYTALAGPLTRHMSAQSSMIAIDVLSPFSGPDQAHPKSWRCSSSCLGLYQI